jgi:hypothetical protein
MEFGGVSAGAFRVELAVPLLPDSGQRGAWRWDEEEVARKRERRARSRFRGWMGQRRRARWRQNTLIAMACAFRLVPCVMLSVFDLVCLPSLVSRFWLKNRQAGVFFVEGEGKIKEKNCLRSISLIFFVSAYSGMMILCWWCNTGRWR